MPFFQTISAAGFGSVNLACFSSSTVRASDAHPARPTSRSWGASRPALSASASRMRTRIARRGVEVDPTTFAETSTELARRFNKDDGWFRKGVLIVTRLRTGNQRLPSLIKLDYEFAK